MSKNVSQLVSIMTCAVVIITVPGCITSWGDSSKKTPESDANGVQAVEKCDAGDSRGPRAIEDGSTVIVDIDGVPVVTENSLNAFLDEVAQENDQVKMLLQIMPAEIKKNALQAQVEKEVVALAAQDVLEKDPQAAQQFAERLEKVAQDYKNLLYVQALQESLPEATVNASEVRAFYDENKDTNPSLLIQPGGVASMGIQFDNAEQANEFYQAAMGAPAKFEATAEQQGIGDKVRQFGNVSAQSFGVDSAIRDTLSGLTQFPSVQLITISDNNIWVVAASEKHEPEYRSFEEIKEEIHNGLAQQKQQEQLQEEIDRLKNRYNVNINQEFIDSLDQQSDARKMMLEEQMSGAMGQMDDEQMMELEEMIQ